MLKRHMPYVKYIMKTISKPIGTVFEIEYGTPNQRKVNRFQYIRYTLKGLKAIRGGKK